MKAVLGEPSIRPFDTGLRATSTKTKLLAILEVSSVFALIMTLLVALRSTAVYQWEIGHLGWSYVGMSIYVGIPAVVVWLTRRSWAEVGVSSADWRTNLGIGIKATLVRCIPTWFGYWAVMLLPLGDDPLVGSVFTVLLWMVALALMVWILNRQKAAKSARRNVITILGFLFLPLVFALAMSRLSVVILSTVVWQFAFSGFGEEFVYRGYYQSRLNQAFGRPVRLFGIQFGVGLILASLLFGLNHAFNTYDPAIGVSSLAWGSAAGSFAAGLFFGVLREKTGTLVTPGLAHGLLDALGEPLMKMFGWT
jgi:membrane protease YdiL (CAAX protease family)